MGCGCSGFDGNDNEFIDNEINESKVLDFYGDFNASNNEKYTNMNTNYLGFSGDENEFSDFGKKQRQKVGAGIKSIGSKVGSGIQKAKSNLSQPILGNVNLKKGLIGQATAQKSPILSGLRPKVGQATAQLSPIMGAVRPTTKVPSQVGVPLGGLLTASVGKLRTNLPNSFYLNRKNILENEIKVIDGKLMNKRFKTPLITKTLQASRKKKFDELAQVKKILNDRGLSSKKTATKSPTLSSIAQAQAIAKQKAQMIAQGIAQNELGASRKFIPERTPTDKDISTQKEVIGNKLKREGLLLDSMPTKLTQDVQMPQDPLGLDLPIEDEILTQTLLNDDVMVY